MTKRAAATPASAKEGQISKVNIKKLAALLQEDPKTTKWNAIRNILLTYQPDKKDAPYLGILLRQALDRACHGKSGRSTLELILKKMKCLSLSERILYASMAARCKNMEALEVIVYDDPSVVLFCPDDDACDHGEEIVPLLNEVCLTHGWNEEIRFILNMILKTRGPKGNDSRYNHEGLFYETEFWRSPLMLMMDNGESDLDDIVDHLRDNYPEYLKANLFYVSEAISEYEEDMDLLRDLISWSDSALLFGSHPRNGSSLLGLACCKHNQEMVHCLCHQYFAYYRFGEESLDTYNCLLRVQNHLSEANNAGMTPLGDLLLSVCKPDADFAWGSTNECVSFFTLWEAHYLEDEEKMARPVKRFQFQILHLFLSQMWERFLAVKKCVQILSRIVHRLEINVRSVEEESGNTLLSIVIQKMSTVSTASDTKKSLEMLDFFIDPDTAGAAPNPPAMIRDGSGRLPLHSACEHSLPWKDGLERIVNENMPALEQPDPITGLLPFAHCAVGAKSDLDSIYELLRLHPISIEGVRTRSVPN